MDVIYIKKIRSLKRFTEIQFQIFCLTKNGQKRHLLRPVHAWIMASLEACDWLVFAH